MVVVGASGNVGTSVLRALGDDEQIASILGLCRRVPSWSPPKTEWASVDLGADTSGAESGGAESRAGERRARERRDELVEHFRDADAVIHLAWLFQPTHDPVITWRTNVLGTLRVLDAVAAAGVPALVYASSVGAYSPGPKDRTVDESWPTHGWPTAAYCREKAYVERVLDSFEPQYPEIRVVRMRPGFIFKRQAAGAQRRLFAGPLLPDRLVRPALLPVVPDLPGMRFQVLHTDDAAEAYRLAAVRPVRGVFNLAAEPWVDARLLAELLGARAVRMSSRPARRALAAAWRLHLVPASPELFEAALRLPMMDVSRAHEELGWSPRYSAAEAVQELLHGLRHGNGLPTPPLSPGGPARRAQEVASGVGSRP